MKTTLALAIASALSMPALSLDVYAGQDNHYSEKSENHKHKHRHAGKEIMLDQTMFVTCEAGGTYTLAGKGQTYVLTDETLTAIEINGCAHVNISNVNFTSVNPMNRDQGTFSAPNMIGGHALLIKNPVESNDDLKVNLSNITVEGFGNHSIYIADIDADGNCAGGTGGDCGAGSNGSIDINMKNVVIKNGGFGGQDADGLRVDERGDGDIRLNANNIMMQGIGADGIELDEGDNGDVIVKMNNAIFEDNGRYCLMDATNNANPESTDEFPLEYDKSDERICNDDGDADVDDAFDIDEAGAGSIIVTINNAHILHSWDEGLDFDEAGEGDVELKLTRIYGESNRGSAIKADEEDDGSINAFMKKVTVIDTNNDEGIQFTELSDGKINATIKKSTVTDSFKDGIKMEQFADADEDVKDSGADKGRLDIYKSRIENNDADKDGKDQVKVSGMDLYIDGVED